jgi:hypothetical protein
MAEHEDGPLSLFLAERYAPRASAEAAHRDSDRLRAASEELASQGTIVRCLGSALVPVDETCFAFCEARSADDVALLGERAEAPFYRVVEAVRV